MQISDELYNRLVAKHEPLQQRVLNPKRAKAKKTEKAESDAVERDPERGTLRDDARRFYEEFRRRLSDLKAAGLMTTTKFNSLMADCDEMESIERKIDHSARMKILYNRITNPGYNLKVSPKTSGTRQTSETRQTSGTKASKIDLSRFFKE